MKKEQVAEQVKENELLYPGFSPRLCQIVYEAVNKVQFSGREYATAIVMASVELERVLREWQEKQPKKEPEKAKKVEG